MNWLPVIAFGLVAPTFAGAQTVNQAVDAMTECVAFVLSDGQNIPPEVAPEITRIIVNEGPGLTCDLSGPDPDVFEAAATSVAIQFTDPTILRIDIGVPGFDQLTFGGCLDGRKVSVGVNGFAAAALNLGTANISWRAVFDGPCASETPQSKVLNR